MACACSKRKNIKYLWTPPTSGPNASLEPMEYNTEIEAKAKVLRKGGSYKPLRA